MMTKKNLIIVLALLACLVLPLCTGCNGCGGKFSEEERAEAVRQFKENLIP